MFNRQGPRAIPLNQGELSEARFKRFLRDFETYERQRTFDETLNTFLDLYSAWMKTKDVALKMRLVMLAFELHRLDPNFQCTLAFTD